MSSNLQQEVLLSSTDMPSSAASSSAIETWDDLDTHAQTQLKAEPMSPFVGSSMTSLSQSHQLTTDAQVESPGSISPSISISIINDDPNNYLVFIKDIYPQLATPPDAPFLIDASTTATTSTTVSQAPILISVNKQSAPNVRFGSPE
ncbi:hypothetical protein BGX26_007076 [Mortierella sp. AD094]|nr:hypothetical protein BGX26_007076 [Mortierella sp. AD094]